MPVCPARRTDRGGKGITITLYGFSIMKEPLEKTIFPAFSAKWKAEHGGNVSFVTSFAGSETVTNQILQGAPADIAILAIERDADRLVQGGAVTTTIGGIDAEQGHRQQNSIRHSCSQR